MRWFGKESRRKSIHTTGHVAPQHYNPDSDEALAAAYERASYRGGAADNSAQRNDHLDRHSGSSSMRGQARDTAPDLLSFEEPEGEDESMTLVVTQ